MPDPNTRDLKLIQYLNEAYGKEKELETSLEAHIAMSAGRPPYKKRLQEHLRETKRHAKDVERRIKALGGKAEAVSAPGPVGGVAARAQEVAGKAAAAAQGPLHMLRGTGEEEKLLKNAKTEYWNEAEEIATYTAIVALAETVGDRETAKVAKAIRREEERMQKFLERLIPQLTKAVARAEIPAAERKGSRSRRRSGAASRRSSGTSRAASSRAGSRKSAAGTARKSAAGSARKTASGTARKAASRSGGSRRATSRSGRSRSSRS